MSEVGCIVASGRKLSRDAVGVESCAERVRVRAQEDERNAYDTYTSYHSRNSLLSNSLFYIHSELFHCLDQYLEAGRRDTFGDVLCASTH